MAATVSASGRSSAGRSRMRRSGNGDPPAWKDVPAEAAAVVIPFLRSERGAGWLEEAFRAKMAPGAAAAMVDTLRKVHLRRTTLAAPDAVAALIRREHPLLPPALLVHPPSPKVPGCPLPSPLPPPRQPEQQRQTEDKRHRPPTTVLDFGCGDGALLKSARRGCAGGPFDLRCIEPTPVGAPPDGAYVYVLPGDVRPSSVDVAFAHHSLHHAGDVGANVAFLCAALRPGGVLQIKEHDCGMDDPFRANLTALHYVYNVLDGTTVASDLGTAYRSMRQWIRLVRRQPGIRHVSVRPPGRAGLRTFVLRAVKMGGGPPRPPSRGKQGSDQARSPVRHQHHSAKRPV